MRTIKKGSPFKEEVRIWQAIIGAKPDGDFGTMTDRATKAWQREHGIKEDGIVGPVTQCSAGIEQSRSVNLYVFRFPFRKIENMNILLSPRKQLSQFSQGKDVSCNAVMFDMQSGRNVTDLVVDGKLDNGGNYTNKGLKFMGNTVEEAVTADCVGKQCDFIGGAPNLISRGVKNVDMKGLPSTFYTRATQRMAYGFDTYAFYIITTGQSHMCSLETVLQEGLYHKLTALVDVDGGGSTAMWLNGYTVFGAGRPIPTALVMKLTNSYFG